VGEDEAALLHSGIPCPWLKSLHVIAKLKEDDMHCMFALAQVPSG